ncbi:spermidine/putrescine ABC transporter ATP-binding protein [Frigoribacterium sp. Leaf164]|uniref:ABC transporter ATP-binding protein n=1 Tax=Frigoribacterium sp. Leaf164 TaxID=1736282 RepID=UPI0006FC17DD|nr:spermidine/putrescine ABC transporter ATP-binding protein [Frigoribacterium sp. Leaf164]
MTATAPVDPTTASSAPSPTGRGSAAAGARTTSTAGAAVALRGVVKEYAGHVALRGVDLDLAPGELVALLGPSGCGKTTALRTLAGLETVTEGRITVDGRDVVDVPTHRRDVGMVFQAYSLFPHLTVQQNVEFGLRTRRVARAERATRAAEMLDLVGLGELGGQFSHQLSGGQQQRVALARALVTRPRVLLLDEPLSALDAQVRVQLREEIRRLQRELAITTLFVTHDQEEALAVADRVAVMRAGAIEQIGTPEQLYSAPATRFVAEFVGSSNRLRAEVVDGRVRLPGQEVAAVGSPDDGEAWAYVRPEDVTFADRGVAGVVESVSFLGAVCRTKVRTSPDDVVVLDHRAHERREVGESVHVAFTPRAVAVVPFG